MQLVKTNVAGTTYGSFSIGKRGPTIYQGTESPSSGIGSTGDVYINNGSIAELYIKKVDGWTRITKNPTSSISSDYFALPTDDVLIVNTTSGNVSVMMPSPNPYTNLTIKKADSSSNHVEILPYASETIDGASNYTITASYGSITLVSDGTNWFII